MAVWEWVTRRLPSPPKHRAVQDLMKFTKKELAENCWAATVTSDMALMCQAEAMARIVDLVEMIEGKRPVDRKLLKRLNDHRAHVVACRRGSCEHEYAALVRAGLETNAKKA